MHENKIRLIKQVSFKCLDCNTCIKFEVPDPMAQNANEKLKELSDTLNNLVCPKCNAALNVGATKAFDTVKSFNASATFLDICIENGTVELN